MPIVDNFNAIMNRIAFAAKRSGREPSSVKLIVVTKSVDVERIQQAISSGATILGENRVQEAKEKIENLDTIVTWHLIGHLQTNKAKYAVRLFNMIHSVDSLELVKELDKQAVKIGKIQDVLVEVNIAGEVSKTGVAVQGIAAFVREAAKFKNVSIKGLMTIPPFLDDPEAVRPYFRMLRVLAESIKKEKISGMSMGELSMGMSADFEVAIEEGATMVRVGTAIFGGRK